MTAYRIIDNELSRCQKWLGDKAGSVGTDMVVCIGLERNGELIAVTGYNLFNGRSCHVHFCIKKGAYPTRQYIWFVHYYAFIQAGLEMMIAFMAASNERILKLTRHLGYVEKYRLEDAHPNGDMVLCTLSAKNCKFLLGKEYAFK